MQKWDPQVASQCISPEHISCTCSLAYCAHDSCFSLPFNSEGCVTSHQEMASWCRYEGSNQAHQVIVHVPCTMAEHSTCHTTSASISCPEDLTQDQQATTQKARFYMSGDALAIPAYAMQRIHRPCKHWFSQYCNELLSPTARSHAEQVTQVSSFYALRVHSSRDVF